MHKVNELFYKAIEELWAIKNYSSKIELKDLIDLYKEFQFNINLPIDVINAQIIQHYGSDIDLPFSDADITYMIETCITYNEYRYNRLLVESLCVLNCAASYSYLNEILETDDNKNEFMRDFEAFPNFEDLKAELKKLGNDI